MQPPSGEGLASLPGSGAWQRVWGQGEQATCLGALGSEWQGEEQEWPHERGLPHGCLQRGQEPKWQW